MLTTVWRNTARFAACVLLLGATATAQMKCAASVEPRSLRYHGAAELLGDLVVDCQGGSGGSYQVIVSADAPITSRTLSANDSLSVQWTEALLLVDDPSPQQQRVCAPDPALAEEDPDVVDCGANEGSANVFQGLRLQDNAVVFLDTPLTAPGPAGKRRLRIVNLRVDVRDLTPEQEDGPDPEDVHGVPSNPAAPQPEEVRLTVSIFGPGGQSIPVEQHEQLAGVLAPGVKFDIRTAGNAAVPEGEPALLTTPELTPQARPEEGPTFLVQFSELSANVFRRRNAGTNGTDPNFVTSQAYPGIDVNTESGIFNAAYPNVRGLNRAGLSDAGTRLRVSFDKVPPGVRIWASYRDVETGTSGYDPDVPRARLTAPEGGTFRPQVPEKGSFVDVWPSNGHAEILWEVTSSEPAALETLSFSIGLTGPNRDVEFGDAVVVGDIAPEFLEPENEFAIAAEVIPSFDLSSKIIEPRAAFSVVPALEMSELSAVSAASYASGDLAAGSIISGFGEGLAPEVVSAVNEIKMKLGTTRVNVVDSGGALRPAGIFAAGPMQVNLYLDAATRVGPAVVTVYDGARAVAEGLIHVSNVSPGLFSANGDGQGAAAGELMLVSGSDRTTELLAEYQEDAGTYSARELDISGADHAYLVLYGTGFRKRSSLADVRLTVGDVDVPVIYAGEQPEFLGLDQLNAGPLPAQLAGRGLVNVQLVVDGIPSNTVQVRFR